MSDKLPSLTFTTDSIIAAEQSSDIYMTSEIMASMLYQTGIEGSKFSTSHYLYDM
jgi:hypothetical protein